MHNIGFGLIFVLTLYTGIASHIRPRQDVSSNITVRIKRRSSSSWKEEWSWWKHWKKTKMWIGLLWNTKRRYCHYGRLTMKPIVSACCCRSLLQFCMCDRMLYLAALESRGPNERRSDWAPELERGSLARRSPTPAIDCVDYIRIRAKKRKFAPLGPQGTRGISPVFQWFCCVKVVSNIWGIIWLLIDRSSLLRKIPSEGGPKIGLVVWRGQVNFLSDFLKSRVSSL